MTTGRTREWSESDGPEDVWAWTHGDELVGLEADEAAAVVRAAGFRPSVFHADSGAALALLKVSGTVVLIASGGVVRGVRR